MAWGRKTTAAQKPAWSQDDYHKAFAGKLKEQIEQGVAPWQKPCPPYIFSVSRPATSNDVYNCLRYIQLFQFILA